MAGDSQCKKEITHLPQMAAEYRLKAIKSQLSLGFTLCAIAETQIRYRRLDEALKVLNKLHHHAEIISFHVDEPNHVPTSAITDLREQLTQLKKRAEQVESCLCQR